MHLPTSGAIQKERSPKRRSSCAAFTAMRFGWHVSIRGPPEINLSCWFRSRRFSPGGRQVERCDTGSPFRTTKEKPIRGSTEECRSIWFSYCPVPAATVRSYAESRLQSESEYSFINQGSHRCARFSRSEHGDPLDHKIHTQTAVPNLGTKKWAQYSTTILTISCVYGGSRFFPYRDKAIRNHDAPIGNPFRRQCVLTPENKVRMADYSCGEYYIVRYNKKDACCFASV